MDGEHVTPPRDIPSSPASTYASLDDDVSSVADSAPNTPRMGSLRTVKPISEAAEVEVEVSLRSILELFNVRDGQVEARNGLTEAGVQKVLKGIVEGSNVDNTTKRWLLGQMKSLVSVCSFPCQS